MDWIVRELKWYNVKVAGYRRQSGLVMMYDVSGAAVLTSGRKTPSVGENSQRGEGVAIVLMGWAVEAWKACGSKWRAWSPRLVSACVQVGKKKLHVVSCYAPTRTASREEKNNVFGDLDDMLCLIPEEDMYVILGDFNARVGSREEVSEDWSRVRGPHGYGTANDAGKEVLAFLAAHQATLCNTWFRKIRPHCAIRGSERSGHTVQYVVQKDQATLCNTWFRKIRPHCAIRGSERSGHTVQYVVQKDQATLCNTWFRKIRPHCAIRGSKRRRFA